MIKVKKITMTPADIFACFAVPQEVLPAPASGYVNNILAISHDMVFVTLAYTGATRLSYQNYNGASVVFYDDTILASGASRNFPADKGNNQNQLSFTTKNALLLTTNGPAATGDSNIDVYIVYEVVRITA